MTNQFQVGSQVILTDYQGVIETEGSEGSKYTVSKIQQFNMTGYRIKWITLTDLEESIFLYEESCDDDDDDDAEYRVYYPIFEGTRRELEWAFENRTGGDISAEAYLDELTLDMNEQSIEFAQQGLTVVMSDTQDTSHLLTEYITDSDIEDFRLLALEDTDAKVDFLTFYAGCDILLSEVEVYT